MLELAREALTRARGLVRPDYVRRLLADPNGERTTLDGSKLWQVALLELWLQRHVGCRRRRAGASAGSRRAA